MKADNLSGYKWVVASCRQSILEPLIIDPRTVGSRDIVVATTYSGVSSGTEAAIYTASDAQVYQDDGWCRYPCAMGYSGVGRVVAKGDAVAEFALGDRVIGMLGHAAFTKLDVDRMIGRDWSNQPVCLAHEEIDDYSAAFIRIAGIAMTAVELLRPRRFFPVAGIYGLGIIGNIAAQILRHAGYFVVGIDPDPFRRSLAMSVGIDAVLDPRAGDFPTEVLRLAPGGLAAAIDTVGDGELTVTLPQFLRMRGELVLMTHWRQSKPVDTAAFVQQIFRKGISVHGGLEYGPGSEPWESWAQLQFAKWRQLQEMVLHGRLHLKELVTLVVTPEDHESVYRMLADGSKGQLACLVDWSSARSEEGTAP